MLDQHNELPEDENEPFEVKWQSWLNTDKEFANFKSQDIVRYYLSTRRLIQLSTQCSSSVIQVDGTYKLIWQGYPVFMVGTSDYHHVFHPFGIGVVSHETADDYEFIFRSVQYAIRIWYLAY